MTSTRPMQLWLLSDGKPGHVSQSVGVVRALSKHRELHRRRLEVRLRSRAWRPLLRRVLNGPRPPRAAAANALLRLAYTGLREVDGRPDLVVSCGGETIYANALMGRAPSVVNVFLGTLRGLRPERFDAVVSGLHLPGVPNLVELTLSPGAFDREAARQAATELRAGLQLGGGGPLWSLLIGGAGAGYRYGADDIAALCHFLAAAHESHGVRWLLSTSRRTGPRIERQLNEFLARHPGVCAHSVLFGDSPKRLAAAYLGAGERLFVTEDSSSMLSEAMLCRCPVVSLKPAAHRPGAHYARFLEKHRSAGRLRSVDLRNAAADLDELLITPCGESVLDVDQEIRDGLMHLMPSRTGKNDA